MLSVAGTRTSGGGTSRSVTQLADALHRQEIDTSFFCLRPDSPGYQIITPRLAEANVIRIEKSWGPLRIARLVRCEFTKFAELFPHERLIVHDNGVWLPFNHGIARFSAGKHLIRVVSPRGMLSSWSLQYGKWKKRAAWFAYQRRDLADATAFHATSDEEASDIRALGLRQPICVIPNGIDFPNTVPSKNGAGNRRTILFLSRIHAKKGLLNLVRAWRAASLNQDWRLVIAGPNLAGHREEVERLVGDLGLQAQVEFPGEISDSEKWRWFAEADAFVLPSFSENFGLVVAEALAAGTPVVATTGMPWSELPKIGAGWQVEPNVEGLASALRQIAAKSREDLEMMGQRGASWVRRRFCWDDVSQGMSCFYHWLLTGGKPESFIHL